MKKYFALLRHDRNFRILFSVGFICSFGVWFSVVGVYSLLIKLNAPVWAISITALFAFIPSVFTAPINGIIIDKFHPKPLLIAMFVTEILTIFGLIFINSLDFLWLLLLIIIIRTIAGTLFFQTQTSALPKFLSKSALKLANEMTGLTWTITYTLGMSLSGIFIHYFGVKTAFIVDFLLYLGAFFLLIRLKFTFTVSKTTQNALEMPRGGLIYIKKTPLVRHYIVIHAFVAFTTYDSLVALLAQYKYAEILSASLVIGLLNMSRSIAAFFGINFLSQVVNERTFFWIILAQGVGIFAWAILEFNFWISLIGAAGAGFCITSVWSYSFTQLQKSCEREYLGRVIAYNDMAYFLVASMTGVMVGALFKIGLNLSLITAVLGFMFFIAAFYYKFVIYERYLR